MGAESMGGINLLVNNAGIFPRVEFLEMTENDWDSVFAVNLRAMFLCAQAEARQMISQTPTEGKIINTASMSATIGCQQPRVG